jgi:hypothetical protein
MTSQANFVRPPSFATWLVNLFTVPEEESIVGDLFEEFCQLASKLGVGFARRWYWRQAVKTTAHLFGTGFRDAPWSTSAAVVGGYLLGAFLHGLPDKVLSAVTDTYLAYWSKHFKAYMFWATDGMLMAHVILSTLVGSMVALAAKGREMVATMTLGLILGALGVAGSLAMVARTGDGSFLWIMLLQFADSFAMVIGGAIVRTRRSAATTRPFGRVN